MPRSIQDETFSDLVDAYERLRLSHDTLAAVEQIKTELLSLALEQLSTLTKQVRSLTEQVRAGRR